MYLAQIHVTYKPSILDPQAVAIKNAMHRLSFIEVANVVQGKYFELNVDVSDEAEATEQVNAICTQLLANPNMETYRFELKELAKS